MSRILAPHRPTIWRAAIWPAAILPAILLAGGCRKPDPAAEVPGAALEELIAKFEVAMRSGDGEAIARLVAPPGDAFIRERYRIAAETDAARAELEQALDKAFGAPPAGRADAFGSPLAQMVLSRVSIADDARKPKVKMIVQSQKKQADGTYLLDVGQEFDAGGKSGNLGVKITVVETKDGWKIMQPAQLLPPGTDRFASEKQAVKLLRDRAKEVADGLFKNRAEAEDLTAMQLFAIVSDELQESKLLDNLPTLRDDALRLRMISIDSSDPIPVNPPILVQAGPGGKPGLVKLTIGEARSEVKADDLSKTLRQALAPADDHTFAARLSVAKDLPDDDLVKLLHAVVDLRPSLSDGFSLTLEDPRALERVEPRLKGRLQLLLVGMGRPPTEARLTIDPDLKLDSPRLSDGLPLNLADPTDPAKRPAQSVAPLVPPDAAPAKPSAAPAKPSAAPVKSDASPAKPSGGSPAIGTPSTGGTSTEPNNKHP